MGCAVRTNVNAARAPEPSEFDFVYRIMGHPITVKSIDLGQSWSGIREDMLAAVAA